MAELWHYVLLILGTFVVLSFDLQFNLQCGQKVCFLSSISSSNIDRFSKYFTGTLWRKLTINWLSNIPRRMCQ